MPDIIHIHNYYNCLSPSVLSSIRSYRRQNGKPIKVVFTAHDFHLLCPFSLFVHYGIFSNRCLRLDGAPNIFQVLFYKWDVRGFPFSLAKKLQWLYAYAVNDLDREIDHIISPSEFMEGLLRERYSWLIPVSVIRNSFIGMDAIDSLKRSRDRNDKTLKMVFMGRLSPEKGLLEFIECLRKIDMDYTFKIIGDGHLKQDILKMVVQYGLDDRVVLTGQLEHHLALKELCLSDALVLPSTCYENAPLSLVEGALMGLRLITSSHGGMKEVAGLCGGAYLIEPSDCQSVKGALKRCHEDTVSNLPIRDRDVGFLMSLFSEDTYINKLIDVYGN